ncbi:MAG: hypothetical protein GX604_01940 [Actinobacteria bacterium]|nr:hypothetical protein [Actinomycetota bacterium]
MSEEPLLTSAKIAEKLGVSASKVARIIKQQSIEPSQLKGRCGYYGADAVKKIEATLKAG